MFKTFLNKTSMSIRTGKSSGKDITFELIKAHTIRNKTYTNFKKETDPITTKIHNASKLNEFSVVFVWISKVLSEVKWEGGGVILKSDRPLLGRKRVMVKRRRLIWKSIMCPFTLGIGKTRRYALAKQTHATYLLCKLEHNVNVNSLEMIDDCYFILNGIDLGSE